MAKRKTLQQMEDEFFTEFDRPEVRELIVGLGGIDPCKKGSYIGGVIGGGTGPQGEPGPMGPQGPKGEQGDPMTFNDLTDAQKEALRGPKGDKGDPMTFNDLTDAQKEALRGPKGDKGDPMTFDSLTDAQKAALKGATGATGPQGPKGDTGPQGPQGVQGPKGDKGDKGDQGESEPLPPSDGKIYVMKDQAWTQLNFELVTGEAGAGAGTVTVRPHFETKQMPGTWGMQNIFLFKHEGKERFIAIQSNSKLGITISDNGVDWEPIFYAYNSNMNFRVDNADCCGDRVYFAHVNSYSDAQAFLVDVFDDPPPRTHLAVSIAAQDNVAASDRYVVYAKASGRLSIIEPSVSNSVVAQTRTGLVVRDFCYSPDFDLFVGIGDTNSNRKVNVTSTVLKGTDLSVETSTWSYEYDDEVKRTSTLTWHPDLKAFVTFAKNIPWVSANGLDWFQVGSPVPCSYSVHSSVYAKELGMFFVTSSNGKNFIFATRDFERWTTITKTSGFSEYYKLLWSGHQRRLFAYGYNNPIHYLDF